MGNNKYGSRKREYKEMVFDSGRELRRYQELELLLRAGKIADLRRQVDFELIPEQRGPDTLGPRGGRRRGRVLERSCHYVADFVYTMPTNTGSKTIVEDAKGHRTKDYIIKRKLMLLIHGIRISEV